MLEFKKESRVRSKWGNNLIKHKKGKGQRRNREKRRGQKCEREEERCVRPGRSRKACAEWRASSAIQGTLSVAHLGFPAKHTPMSHSTFFLSPIYLIIL